ncbi:MAG TPA: hypothetical protein VFN25_02495 [Dokdonella sp.]|uniref:hypothetical protein n=1 Tax=Dokdonella sp. TaxID=2291710 RepID=UPI002D8111A5|nr:hypothetical protein [Dokdonella sp.]HET9031754.1 hypothetical protein [Dokdonella sp.]
MRPNPLAIALATILLASAPLAEASTDPQIAALAERIRALEANAQVLQKQAADALAAAQAAQSELHQMIAAQQQQSVAQVSAEPAASSTSASTNAFNPAIALILNGLFVNHSQDPLNYQRAGFPLVGEGEPSLNGLQLGESEISFAANIDDKFYGQLTLTMASENGETDTGIEEAYIETTALPDGFTARAGRFYSNIGYLNSHHTHTDYFSDRPLAYQAFLGNQYGDDGVQIRWVAPTDIYLELGSEAFRGESAPASGAAHDGIGAKTFFVHAGGDVGFENSWLAGASILHTDSVNGEDGFSGRNNLFLFDFTWKWAPHGAFKDSGVVVRSEAFIDDRDGMVIDPQDPDALAQAWNGKRHGAYIEGLYRFSRTWDVGYRYDKLWAASSGPYASDFNPTRHTVDATWHNSEFSLLRLQFSHDQPQPHFIDNVLSLQYQVSLGAHGAHKF